LTRKFGDFVWPRKTVRTVVFLQGKFTRKDVMLNVVQNVAFSVFLAAVFVGLENHGQVNGLDCLTAGNIISGADSLLAGVGCHVKNLTPEQ
jgi:hypothetical protein